MYYQMPRPWPYHSLKLFCVCSVLQQTGCNAGSRGALTRSSLMKLFSISRVVSLGSYPPHPPKNPTKQWKQKKSVGNYLKARLPSRLWSFNRLGVIWIKQSISVLLEGEIWRKEGKDDKYKHWVGNTHAFKVAAENHDLREGNSKFLF